MLEEKDLEKIGEIVRKEVKSEVTAAVKSEVTAAIKSEVTAVVKAEFEVAEKRITENIIREVVDSVSTLTENLEKNLTEKMDTLADKVSVNRMVDQSIERDQKLDTKIHAMGDFLQKRQTLTAGEIAQLHAMKVVVSPSIPLQ